eukprot:TRINITY_DN33694_c0_g1_i1.p1 TRINITY_DN33694_c0_g1~~TRINITY_DN33694_c0_g1_i1.p1  ORF type:complete len:529 (-),score=98.21 TRINITY_DN33694_c0_g1_i1:126-1712(-)
MGARQAGLRRCCETSGALQICCGAKTSVDKGGEFVQAFSVGADVLSPRLRPLIEEENDQTESEQLAQGHGEISQLSRTGSTVESRRKPFAAEIRHSIEERVSDPEHTGVEDPVFPVQAATREGQNGQRARSPTASRAPNFHGPGRDMGFEIVVHNAFSGNQLCVVAGSCLWNIYGLKLAIEEATGIPRREQRLLQSNRILLDRESLSKVLNSKERVVQLVRLSAAKASALDHISSGKPFRELEETCRSDREVALAAARRGGEDVLGFAAEELRRDRELVLLAVQSFGISLKDASIDLRHDPEVVLTAVRSDGRALSHAADRLRRDREFVGAALRVNGYALGSVAEELQQDFGLAMIAIQSTGGLALGYASAELRGRRDLVLAAVELNGTALRFATKELRRDRAVVLVAAQSAGFDALAHASDDLRREFMQVPEPCQGHYMEEEELQIQNRGDARGVGSGEAIDRGHSGGRSAHSPSSSPLHSRPPTSEAAAPSANARGENRVASTERRTVERSLDRKSAPLLFVLASK